MRARKSSSSGRTRGGGVVRLVGSVLFCLCFVRSSLGQTQADAPRYSVTRGFFSAPFDVTLTTTTPSASIWYTTDGSAPSATNGTRYTGALRIDKTTVLRAVTTAPGFLASRVKTHSYLYLEQVLKQPRSITGWPEKTYQVGFLEPPEWPIVQWFSAKHDYEMDPAVVGDLSTRDDLVKGLREIPTVSLAMSRSDFWAVNDSEEDSNVEKPVSVEILYPDGDTEHEDGGLIGHSHPRLKRSFRLAFRAEYGATKLSSNLLKRGPLHGDSAEDRFNKLILRAGNNRSWARIFNDGRAAYTRDEWYRATQIEMGGGGSRGEFVHLYVNGLYWGLYDVCERPDHHFTSDYYGGLPEDWYAWSSYSSVSGDPSWFNWIWQRIIYEDLNDPYWYQQLKDHLDIANFADYLLVTWYIGMTDWPMNNFYGGNRNTPFHTPFMHFAWDGEWSLDVTHGSSNGAWVHPFFRTDYTGTAYYKVNIWRAVRKSREYMVMFSDRVYKHLSKGGAMSDEASRARWSLLNSHIRNAVVAESARWGDAMEENGHRTRTRALDWDPEVRRVDAIFDGNAARFLAALRAQGYYPAFDPPVFSPDGGTIKAGSLITLSTANGSLYYTTDGSDPRLVGGAVSPSAKGGGQSATIGILTGTTVRARVKVNDAWSALAERTFYTTQDFTKLVINEIHYHPQVPPTEDPETYEFIELYNVGATPLELSGVRFSDGIDFTFPIGATLGAKQFVVLAHDGVGFQARYGFAPDGVYTGKLANDGERIELSAPSGAVIDSVAYDDAAPWPLAADGVGPSLELVNPLVDNYPSDRWQASAVGGGTPKMENSVKLAIELEEFQALRRHAELDVTWVTASETGNLGYYVDHAFEEEAAVRGPWIPGAGSTSEGRSYAYTIHDPAPGRHHLVLWQVSEDGRENAAAEAVVYVPMTADVVLRDVYPNPFSGRASVDFAVRQPGAVRLELVDALGRRVRSIYVGQAERERMMKVELNGEGLGAGMYFLRLVTDESVATRPVFVVP